MLNLFQILQTIDSTVTPERCKVHLARVNPKGDNPLDIYLAGDFDAWQEWQTRENFKRELVVSLIQLPQRNRWLFAGVHDALGLRPAKVGDQCLRYNLKRRESTNELCGRLVVHFERTGRQSYLIAEKWTDSMLVAELRSERYQVTEFTSFTQTLLTKQELDIIVRQQIPSWVSALSSVAGVYVISDTQSGKLYIGSATGDQGIWGRWRQYAKTGHGNNKELKALLNKVGIEHAEHFQFGILETADSNASTNEIIARETHWKQLLLTRSHGHNAN